jgi:hypothetical protein
MLVCIRVNPGRSWGRSWTHESGNFGAPQASRTFSLSVLQSNVGAPTICVALVPPPPPAKPCLTPFLPAHAVCSLAETGKSGQHRAQSAPKEEVTIGSLITLQIGGQGEDGTSSPAFLHSSTTLNSLVSGAHHRPPPNNLARHEPTNAQITNRSLPYHDVISDSASHIPMSFRHTSGSRTMMWKEALSPGLRIHTLQGECVHAPPHSIFWCPPPS